MPDKKKYLQIGFKVKDWYWAYVYSFWFTKHAYYCYHCCFYKILYLWIWIISQFHNFFHFQYTW